ncbi:MAG: CAP domain-containing protein [Patescibacteria group bacterium]|jgi:hypothetical protein
MHIIDRKKYFGILVGFGFCLLFLLPQSAAAQIYDAKSIFQLINLERQKYNAGTLSENTLLEQAAVNKANDMAEKNYFTHQSPIGKMPWDFAVEAGYRYSILGENLAIDWPSAAEVVQAWMDSPSHKKNILNSEFSDTGIAVINYNGHFLVVQIFGKANEVQNDIVPITLPAVTLPAVPAEKTTTNLIIKPSSASPIVNEQSQLTVTSIITNKLIPENMAVLGANNTKKSPPDTNTMSQRNLTQYLIATTFFPLALGLFVLNNPAHPR